MDSGTPTRTYRSTLRDQQARATRERIVAAAGDLFSRLGFSATTMAAIARAAGVSTETVKAAGSKAQLLLAAFEVAFSGVEGARTLAETPVAAGLQEHPAPELLPTVLDAIATANERGHALWSVLVAAAMSDDAVGEALHGILDQRRADFALLVATLQEHGATVSDPARLAAELSFLLSPEGYQQLVVQSGWTRADYIAWLAAGIDRLTAPGAVERHPRANEATPVA